MNAWPNLEQIFIANACGLNSESFPNGGVLKEEFLELNPEYFEMNIVKPASAGMEGFNSPLYQEQLRFYRDGSMERVYLYHTYPQQTIDGIYLLNPFAQKILDRYRKERLEGEMQND